MTSTTLASKPGFDALEAHRRELFAHCYRMLGSPFEAEDAVQEALLRAWRSLDSFQGRAALRSWLYRIATNVCLDMLGGKERRARPMDMSPARPHDGPLGGTLPEAAWIEPVPDALIVGDGDGDPAELAESRETVKLAFVAALQHLPPRQRAALLLCEVLKWKAGEVAELLDTSVASVNSALQRARATLDAADLGDGASADLEKEHRKLLERYVDAFQRYDMDALTTLIHEDAKQSMPPFELWLQGRENILGFWVGHGHACRGSRVVSAMSANGEPAFAQYKPAEDGNGYTAWALQVLRLEGDRIAEFTFFLDTKAIFPLFGLPLRLDA